MQTSSSGSLTTVHPPLHVLSSDLNEGVRLRLANNRQFFAKFFQHIPADKHIVLGSQSLEYTYPFSQVPITFANIEVFVESLDRFNPCRIAEEVLVLGQFSNYAGGRITVQQEQALLAIRQEKMYGHGSWKVESDGRKIKSYLSLEAQVVEYLADVLRPLTRFKPEQPPLQTARTFVRHERLQIIQQLAARHRSS